MPAKVLFSPWHIHKYFLSKSIFLLGPSFLFMYLPHPKPQCHHAFRLRKLLFSPLLGALLPQIFGWKLFCQHFLPSKLLLAVCIYKEKYILCWISCRQYLPSVTLMITAKWKLGETSDNINTDNKIILNKKSNSNNKVW